MRSLRPRWTDDLINSERRAAAELKSLQIETVTKEVEQETVSDKELLFLCLQIMTADERKLVLDYINDKKEMN
jgi:hypothetical protein